MLVLSRKPNEVIMIGSDIKITVLNIQARQVRLGFEAPEAIEVHREEVFKKIQQEKANRNLMGENA